MEPEQLRLFTHENPLRSQFKKSFFKQLPTYSGVYLFFDRFGKTLYVGKAKNLRKRLNSYTTRNFFKLPHKTQKLLYGVWQIEVEKTENEALALLRENQLIRELKPSFNVVNTKSNTYLQFGIRRQNRHLELQLMFNSNIPPQSLETYGAFKGISNVKLAHAALCRWLWTAEKNCCDWAMPLTRKTAPSGFQFQNLNQDLEQHLREFLSGLNPLPELLLPEESPSPFLQRVFRDDQIRLAHFFKTCQRLRNLKIRLGLDEKSAISAQELDDLMVIDQTGL